MKHEIAVASALLLLAVTLASAQEAFFPMRAMNLTFLLDLGRIQK